MLLWDDTSNLWLLTPAELERIPNGTVLTCIDGTTAVKGRDYIDDDTRAGHIAYGILRYEQDKLFTEFYLKR